MVASSTRGRRAAPRKASIAVAKGAATVAKGAAATSVGKEERIAKMAYFLAEARGFALGGELDDWLAAEAQYDATVEND